MLRVNNQSLLMLNALVSSGWIHRIAFTKLLNDPNVAEDLRGFSVVAAYPFGSRDIEVSVNKTMALP